jgi:hypothetical protein
LTQTVATADDRETMLCRGDELWEQLRAALDARIARPAYDAHDWTGHDVYAHFARWQSHAHGELGHILGGEPLTPIEGDEDEINRRWAAEDRALPTDVVRQRCIDTRAEFRAALMSLTANQWDRFGRACSPDVSGEHYEHHLAGLVAEDQP